ncbi:MAG TPA: cupin domain-containing protein, partial [Nitrospira sp.]|nr:cupin domain-containing protein [Nitrospira sp.]
AETVEFGPGDVGYVPQGYGHYLENVGGGDSQVLLVLNSGEYQDISVSEWFAANPPDLLAQPSARPSQRGIGLMLIQPHKQVAAIDELRFFGQDLRDDPGCLRCDRY